MEIKAFRAILKSAPRARQYNGIHKYLSGADLPEMLYTKRENQTSLQLFGKSEQSRLRVQEK